MVNSGAKELENLLGALDDIETGTNKNYQRRIDNGETDLIDTTGDFYKSVSMLGNLLESLNDVGLDYGKDPDTSLAREHIDLGIEYNVSDYLVEDKLDSIYGGEFIYSYDENETPPELPPEPLYATPISETHKKQQSSTTPAQHQYRSGPSWRLVEENVLGMKSAKSYGIQNIHNNQVILDNIMMYESATALLAILNKGLSLTNPKVLGIISSGIQYTNVVQEAMKSAKERQQVLRESRYDRAQELDTVILEQKQKALDLKNKVLKFLTDEGFM